MVEEHEELIEQWWFNEYSASENADLHQYLCIDNIKGKISTNTYVLTTLKVRSPPILMY